MKKFLYSNLCTSVTASSENPNFPASNCLTDDPAEIFKGTSNSVTLTCAISAGNSCIIFNNTNAETIAITIKDVPETSTLVAQSTKTLTSGTAFLIGNTWYSYTTQAVAVHAICVLTADATHTIECGIVRAGVPISLAGLKYNFSEELIDHGITQQLNDGTEYYHDGDMVRQYSGSLITSRASVTAAQRYLALKKNNLMPILISDQDSEDWTIYGRVKKFSPRHIALNLSEVDVEIKEEIQTLRAQV